MNATLRLQGSTTADVSLRQITLMCSGLQLASSHTKETENTAVSLAKPTTRRDKTAYSTRQNRRPSFSKQSTPHQGKMKDELARLARGRRKLKASLETDEEASKIILLRGLIRLWCHECVRVYGDHWGDLQDSNWVSNLINHTAKVSFCGPSALKELGARSEQSAVMTARRKGKRPGRNLPVLPATLPDESDSTLSLFDGIRNAGYNVELLSSAYKEMRLPLLLPLEQVTMRGEDLSQFLFAPTVTEEDHSLTADSTTVGMDPSLDPSSFSLQPVSTASLVEQHTPGFVYKELDDREGVSVVEGHMKGQSSTHARVAPHRKLTEQVLRICRILVRAGKSY